jgi:anti-sigma regulatory factor (Ser/Thr protein kinase)
MSAHTPGPKPRVDFNSDTLDVRLDLRFPADLEKLPQMVDSIMQVVSTMECAQGHEPGIELSLHEAMANAIRHGAGNDPKKMIEVKVACEAEHGMLIVVGDPGDGFDPHRVADPLQADNVYSDHGRGIFLINRLMDEVEFKRGGTEIHMRKFTKPAGKNGEDNGGSDPR